MGIIIPSSLRATVLIFKGGPSFNFTESYNQEKNKGCGEDVDSCRPRSCRTIQVISSPLPPSSLPPSSVSSTVISRVATAARRPPLVSTGSDAGGSRSSAAVLGLLPSHVTHTHPISPRRTLHRNASSLEGLNEAQLVQWCDPGFTTAKAYAYLGSDVLVNAGLESCLRLRSSESSARRLEALISLLVTRYLLSSGDGTWERAHTWQISHTL